MTKMMTIDPLVAKAIDEAAQLPILELRFDDYVDANTKSKISTAFEAIRSDIEYELFVKPLIFGTL